MKVRTFFICMCLIMVFLFIGLRYLFWRDANLLQGDEIETTQTFSYG